MGIIDNILTQCTARIGAASGVTKAVRPLKNNEKLTIEDFTVIVRASDPDRLAAIDRAGNPPAIGWLLPIHVNCIVIPSKNNPDDYDKIWADFTALVQTAVTSVPDWWRFGGNCVNSELGPVTRLEPNEETPGGGRFVIAAQYRVDETNLNNVRG